MEKRIVYVTGMFEGIYGWDEGFKSYEKYEKWNAFWDNINETYWEYFKSKDIFATQYLVSTSGGIYLHPMDFNTILDNPSKGLLNELNEICKKCAEQCDGTFTMLTKEIDVNFENIEYKRY